MLSKLQSKKAQAAVELAIIGALIILAYSYLVTFTAKINIKQEHLQNVFKKLLTAANTSGKSHASPTFFQRMPNILDPYTPGTLTPIEASGKLLWSGGQATGDSEAEWGKDYQKESGTYHKTFTRTEAPGSYPVTKRTVDFGGVERSGP